MNRNDSGEREVERRLSQLGKELRRNASLAEGVHQQLAQTDANAEIASPGSWFPFLPSVKETTKMQRLTCSATVAAVAIVSAIWLTTSTDSVLLAQVAENLQEVSGYSVDTEIRFPHEGVTKTMGKGQFHWHTSGTMRTESVSVGDESPLKEDRVSIFSLDNPGVSWDNLARTYRIEPAKRGQQSPIMLLHKLADYSETATKNLGAKRIDGKPCAGFEIDLKELDASSGTGSVTLWVDSVTSLPVSVTCVMKGAGPGEMVFSNFRWNPTFTEDFFTPQPPADYSDITPKAKSTDAIVATITSALQVFGDLNDGAYPRVKVIYGDVTLNTAKALAGYTERPTLDQIREDKYARIVNATRGWATINQIMADNVDAAYHGLQVTSADKTKVLFRWQLDNGKYQVIYGDLRHEAVSAEQLKKLETFGSE